MIEVQKDGKYMKLGICLKQDHLVDTIFYYNLKYGDIILDETDWFKVGDNPPCKTLNILRRID